MTDEKRKKKLEEKYPEIKRDKAASEYRQMSMSQREMPCPKCQHGMEYKAEDDFEGWFCVECDKGVDVGTVDDLIHSPDIVKRDKTIVDKSAVANSVNKFRKKRKRNDKDGTDGDSD